MTEQKEIDTLTELLETADNTIEDLRTKIGELEVVNENLNSLLDEAYNLMGELRTDLKTGQLEISTTRQ